MVERYVGSHWNHVQWCDIYDYFIEGSNGVLSDVFGMQHLCEL